MSISMITICITRGMKKTFKSAMKSDDFIERRRTRSLAPYCLEQSSYIHFAGLFLSIYLFFT